MSDSRDIVIHAVGHSRKRPSTGYINLRQQISKHLLTGILPGTAQSNRVSCEFGDAANLYGARENSLLRQAS